MKADLWRGVLGLVLLLFVERLSAEDDEEEGLMVYGGMMRRRGSCAILKRRFCENRTEARE